MIHPLRTCDGEARHTWAFQRRVRLFLSAASLLLFVSCGTTRPDTDPEAPLKAVAAADSIVDFRVFLVGGVGDPSSSPGPALSHLKTQLADAPPRSTVVFLGDNVPPGGLPEAGHPARKAAEQRLKAQLDAVAGFDGRVVFIPGDNDWAGGAPDGFASALRQQSFIDEAADFLPTDGLPGPTAIELSDSVVLIAINTQWWLHQAEKPYGDDGDADIELDEDFLLALDDLLEEYRKQTVLVVGHHPLASSGQRAGRFPLRDHLFPLTRVHPQAYVPLPIVGSLPLLYVRYFGGHRQNLAHPRYASLREHLARIFDRHDRLIYASAHEPALQYLTTEGRVDPRGHLLVSGSASRASYTADASNFQLAASKQGYMILDFQREGSVWVEAWSVENGPRRIFREMLESADPDLVDPQSTDVVALTDVSLPATNSSDPPPPMAANPNYASGPLHRVVFGRQYREEWATPITVPYLDLSREAGGLTLLRRGGGVQTASLRFADGTGVEYVARTVDKDPRRTLPEHLRSVLVEKFVLDFNSSLHPYGALIVPRLAKAAGVYHTNPRLRVIPDDARLGRHREEFAGRLVLFEERPDEDLSAFENFGRSDNVIGTPKLYEEVDGDNDHLVDQRAFARARLLDMLMADWDRHWDQWRWASFEPPDSVGKIYRPVPRDRDWAFSRFDGLVPSLTKYVIPHFQGFGHSYGDLKGLNDKAITLDRRFTSELTRRDWIEIADSVRAALSDKVIDEAVRALPPPIHELRGHETASILKSRRNDLTSIAERHYRMTNRDVDVVGSDKHERFEVTDQGDGTTRVVVRKTTKEGVVRMTVYDRVFQPEETKEIRLYGQDGRDQFIVEGSSGAIRLRAIGGAGEDRFVNEGPDERPRTIFYDSESGNTWRVGERTTRRISADPSINFYDPGYEYDRMLPILAFETNNTHGVVLGGGTQIIRHGFRRDPYAHSHRISAEVASRTMGVVLDYSGHVTSVFGRWNAGLNAEFRSWNNLRNFYGLGNETQEDARNLVQFGTASLAPSIDRRVGAAAIVQVGPVLDYARVSEETENVALPASLTFGENWRAGVTAQFLLDGRDDVANPTEGVRWDTRIGLYAVTGPSDERYASAQTVFSAYATPSYTPQVTLALRAGGAHILGDFPFYAASVLGGDDNLRGFRSSRFGGRSSLFQNLEARLAVLRFSTYVVPGHLGIIAFVDNGRVWADGEQSRAWHQSYGGGVWIRVFERFILSGTYGESEESTAFVLTSGFQF